MYNFNKLLCRSYNFHNTFNLIILKNLMESSFTRNVTALSLIEAMSKPLLSLVRLYFSLILVVKCLSCSFPMKNCGGSTQALGNPVMLEIKWTSIETLISNEIHPPWKQTNNFLKQVLIGLCNSKSHSIGTKLFFLCWLYENLGIILP